MRARKHPHLLDAIFAVAARHLSRLPQYKTPHGILYHGQLLPNLTEHAAVEYMLRCIPALRQFHDIQDDDDYRDSIITTAVILRQLEEIDHEDDFHRGPMQRPVNFLAIIDAVLRSLPSLDAFRQRSLMQAAYWMALRQEIFNSFTRREAPQLMMPPEFWHSASQANKVVMHLVQTAKWHWGGGGEQEWSESRPSREAGGDRMLTNFIVRLAEQQEQLEQHVLINFRPLFQRAADKSRGEIFPTIWYGSNIEVTSVQLGLIAKAVLVAENPSLRCAPRPLFPRPRSHLSQKPGGLARQLETRGERGARPAARPVRRRSLQPGLTPGPGPGRPRHRCVQRFLHRPVRATGHPLRHREIPRRPRLACPAVAGDVSIGPCIGPDKPSASRRIVQHRETLGGRSVYASGVSGSGQAYGSCQC